MKLNWSQLQILKTAHDNEHGKGWVNCPNARATTKAAMKSLRDLGIVEYVVTDKWAGNKLTGRSA